MDLDSVPATGTCDLTTTGRHSGEPRGVEIWYVVVDGACSSSAGPRSWLANLRADPHATVRFRDPDVVIDVVAVEITEPQERHALTMRAWVLQPWYAGLEFTVEDWVAGSPMLRLTEPTGDGA